ncbi:MAG: tRNA lysidine(34) synthetase TilS [Candidatus Lindowbacteria bacterium RIFCSPLOWO2_12_FULL_62_27]|nr:MAG: tRNA lysidine(34) synthetase TilS [Candidatus Lindowbacteria bacterium RIFCSPLOWO2_02_FULL_62_12]OGH60797.1 MAG: tRNA lysidine(34) synthetase TilS [Candidatus Lindowbacteria bacterium RIFCSPLOWO2_12_FULL_62_27]
MSSSRAFVSRFLHFWRTQFGASGAGRRLRLGIGVSGGRDSCVLAALIGRMKAHLGVRRVVLLHLDHGIRPVAERRRDRAVLRALSRRVRAPLVVDRVRLRATGEGLEAAGRSARLKFFSRAARRYRLDAIAQAHHLDDRIETFFLFLLRGSGLRGLTSLRSTETLAAGGGSLNIIRPLLPFTRDEILEFSAAEKISYHEDSTNRDLRFLRNRLRLELIPMLKSWHPGFAKAMAATQQALESEDAALSDLADGLYRGRLDPAELRNWPEAVVARVLQRWGRRRGGSAVLGGHKNLAAAARLIRSAARASLDLPGGRKLLIDRSRIRLAGG